MALDHSSLRCCFEILFRENPHLMEQIRSICRAGRDAVSSMWTVSAGEVKRRAVARFSPDPFHLLLHYPRDPILLEMPEQRMPSSSLGIRYLLNIDRHGEGGTIHRNTFRTVTLDVLQCITFSFDVIRASVSIGDVEVHREYNLRAGKRLHPFGDPMQELPLFLILGKCATIEVLTDRPIEDREELAWSLGYNVTKRYGRNMKDRMDLGQIEISHRSPSGWFLIRGGQVAVFCKGKTRRPPFTGVPVGGDTCVDEARIEREKMGDRWT